MKLYSKQALTVGGIYSVLSAPFFIFETSVTEKIDMFLFSIFIICMFLLYWSKFYLFIEKQTQKFPRISYYLISVGWIPYFVIIGIVGIVGIFMFAGVFLWQDNTLETVINLFNLICIWGFPVSLIIAYIRARILKA